MALIGIVAAGVAAWAFGALYYVLLSRQWLEVAGLPESLRAALERDASADHLPLFVNLAASMLMAGILGLILSQMPPPSLGKGVGVALMLWLGFVATSLAANHAQAHRPLRLTAIEALHWLGALALMGAILGAVG